MQITQILVSILIVSQTASCALWTKQINPSERIKVYKESPSLTNSFAYADELQRRYDTAIVQHSTLSTGSGTALIALAALSAFNIGTSGNTTALLTYGISAGSIFGVERLLKSSTQQKIYAAGADAIHCTLKEYEPIRYLRENGQDNAKINLLTRDSIELRQAVNRLKNIKPRLAPDFQQTLQQYIDAADAALAGTDLMIIKIRNAGADLFLAIDEIRLLVNTALIDHQPDISALATELGASIPTFRQPKTEGDKPENIVEEQEIMSMAQLSSSDESAALLIDQNAMLVPTFSYDLATVQNLTPKLLLELAIFRIAGKSTEQESCASRILNAGIVFSVNPYPELSIQANTGEKKPEPIVITISGGRTPYRANWIGQAPTHISMSYPEPMGAVGKLTLTPVSTNESAEYKLLITDDLKGSKTIKVLLNPKKESKPEENTKKDSSVPGITAEKTMEIQTLLRNLKMRGIDDKGNDVDVAVDGTWGPITESAIRKALTLKDGEPVIEAKPENAEAIIGALRVLEASA